MEFAVEAQKLIGISLEKVGRLTSPVKDGKTMTAL